MSNNIENLVKNQIARKYEPEKLGEIQYKSNENKFPWFWGLVFLFGVIALACFVSLGHAEERKHDRHYRYDKHFNEYQAEIYSLNLQLLAARKQIFDLNASLTAQQGINENLSQQNAELAQEVRECEEDKQ